MCEMKLVADFFNLEKSPQVATKSHQIHGVS